MKKRLTIILIVLLCAYQVPAQRILKTLTGHTSSISSISFSSNGKALLSSSWDKTIRIWNPATGETTKIIETGKSVVFSAAFSKDLKFIACGNWSPKVTIFNATAGDIYKSFDASSFKTNYATYSGDGKILATVGNDTIKLWDVATYSLKAVLAGNTSDINMVAFSPDNSILASASFDGIIKIWNAHNGTMIKTIKAHVSNIPSVAFSPDSKYLLSLGEEGTLKLWDMSTYSCLFTLSKICSGANYADFSSDGKRVAVAGADNNIYIVDIYDQKTVAVLKGHTKPVKLVSFAQGGELLASAGDDNSIIVWDLSDLKYSKCVAEKMLKYSNLVDPKGEFETTDQYNKRLAEYEKTKVAMKLECMKEESLLKIEQIATNEDNQLATYQYVTLGIDEISLYDADKQTYDITIDDKVYSLKMALQEAKTFKTSWQKAEVKGIQRANPTTHKAEYINLQVIHPMTNVSYPLGTQVSAATDKYLKEFLEKNPEPK
jgi:hypothetical protein